MTRLVDELRLRDPSPLLERGDGLSRVAHPLPELGRSKPARIAAASAAARMRPPPPFSGLPSARPPAWGSSPVSAPDPVSASSSAIVTTACPRYVHTRPRPAPTQDTITRDRASSPQGSP